MWPFSDVSVYSFGCFTHCVCVCQSTEADYERIPVEAFGMAMLRGMGWKKSEGIGLTFKQ